MRTLALSLAVLIPAAASAVPLEFTHQGRLLDSAGVALEGPHEVDFAIYADSSTSTPLWSQEEATLQFSSGHYVVQLGSDSSNPVDSSIFDGNTLYLGIAVDSGPELSDRLPIASVPYAVLANSVSGGSVDATSIAINGTELFSSSGELSAAHLGGLTCSDGQYAVFAGNTWSCGSPLSETDVAALGYAKSTDLASVATTGAFSDLAGVPGWLDEVLALTCGEGEMISHDSSGNPTCASLPATSVATGAGILGDGSTNSPLTLDLDMTPRLWSFRQTGDVRANRTRLPLTGLVDVAFSVPWPARVRIDYTAQVNNASQHDGQHCAVWATLDGNALSDGGGYGMGFIQFANTGSNNQLDEWWEYGTLSRVVDVDAGDHSLSMEGNQGWTGSNQDCIFSHNYGGGELIITAYPR